jgi:hypothetical protein
METAVMTEMEAAIMTEHSTEMETAVMTEMEAAIMTEVMNDYLDKKSRNGDRKRLQMVLAGFQATVGS